MHIRTGVVISALVLLGGCASDDADSGDTPSPSGPSLTSSSSPAPGGEIGALYASSWADGERTIRRYAIQADGTPGTATELLSEKADDVDFPGVLDGVGGSALTGSLSEYWTTEVQVRDASSGSVVSKVDAPSWCGGEGLLYNACALLDGTRLARTSELGEEGVQDSTITITSLKSGETLSELGPFPGLSNVLATTDPNTLMILVADTPNTDPPEPRSGTVSALDVTTGSTTKIGTYDADWSALCAIGTGAVLGYGDDGTPTAAVVGDATIGDVTWAQDDTPVGCTADGSYVFVQNIPQPPGETSEDSQAPGAATSVARISLADGTRTQVLALDPGSYADLITR